MRAERNCSPLPPLALLTCHSPPLPSLLPLQGEQPSGHDSDYDNTPARSESLEQSFIPSPNEDGSVGGGQAAAH